MVSASETTVASPGEWLLPETAPTDVPATLRSLHPLVATTIFTSLYLQRFGLLAPSGAFVSAGHLIVPAVGFGLLALGRVRVDLVNLGLLAAFLAYAFSLAAISAALPQVGVSVSPPSIVLLGSLYLIFCLAPVPVEDIGRVLLVYNRHMLVIGLLGILQFSVQFVGLPLFSFKGLVPASFLLEGPYNTVIPLEYASPWFKSNGVFFLEPSLFSQFTAIALAVEVLLFRRTAFIFVYCVAIVVSYSGSGLLTLVTALFIMSLLRPRFTLALVALVAVGGLALAVMSQVVPDLYAYYVGRAFEVRNTDSSSYERYVTPYILLDTVWHGWAVPFGYGPGAAEKFQTGFAYTVNVVVKFLIDYGFIGATLFFTFIGTALLRRRNGLFFIVLCVSWYFLGGGYHLTSCVVHMMAVFLIWSTWPSRFPTTHPAEARDEHDDTPARA